MATILDLLCEKIDLQSKEGELISGALNAQANWYMAPDHATQIKNRDGNLHPCIIRSRKTLKDNFITVWIRSTSDFGPRPRWIPHNPHNHGRCRINKSGYVDLKRFQRIPISYLENFVFSCTEDNEVWLQDFDADLAKIQERYKGLGND